jgi:hypothetical protein
MIPLGSTSGWATSQSKARMAASLIEAKSGMTVSAARSREVQLQNGQAGRDSGYISVNESSTTRSFRAHEIAGALVDGFRDADRQYTYQEDAGISRPCRSTADSR